MLDDSALVVQTELGPNERLLWSGRPRMGILFRTGDIFFIPFSLLWGGFAIFWEVRVIREGAPGFFSLWGIPFVLIGLYMIFGRFIVDALQRGKTYYAVTDKRIIILSGLLSRNVKSLNLRTLSDISLDQRSDGTGTITFGPTPQMHEWHRVMPWPGYPITPSFEMIPNVRRVYEVIVEAQAGAGR